MVVHGHGEVYRRRDLLVYLGVRFLSEAAALAQTVAIGWTIYSLSDTPLSLGIVGIAQFIPMMLLTLPAGELCDRFSPRPLAAAGFALQSLCAGAFLGLTLFHVSTPWPFYSVLLVLGSARALADPAAQALLPLLVPPEQLPRAIAGGSTAWQMAVIAGPALGGLSYALGPSVAYAGCGLAFLTAMAALAALGGRKPVPVHTDLPTGRIARITEGIEFIRSQPIVLGAISLDLFAVLLGGATALLPIYARDILKVGPAGLGMLRSAPAAGACIVAFLQTRYPLNRRVGSRLFSAVTVFGIATVVFALSRSFVASLAALVVIGASDMVSVNIRSSLVQLATPDAMRGRVSAVNMLFIGASSELGAFESGVVASMFGTVESVVFGGIGTLFVAAIWMAAFPALRKADRVHPVTQASEACCEPVVNSLI
ncbi:MFS transporter [Caballeronia sordidicola]|uniref:MFS transporter n=1 Tax=Caballeronia sordidicola TaxID=196367 RepID=UPI0006920477|nr:MFS transporter [Caballeronia sordidicola]